MIGRPKQKTALGVAIDFGVGKAFSKTEHFADNKIIPKNDSTYKHYRRAGGETQFTRFIADAGHRHGLAFPRLQRGNGRFAPLRSALSFDRFDNRLSVTPQDQGQATAWASQFPVIYYLAYGNGDRETTSRAG